MIPIFSEALLPYKQLALQHPYLYPITNLNAVDIVEQCLATTFQPQQVLQSYQAIFDTFFGRRHHLDTITTALSAYFNGT